MGIRAVMKVKNREKMIEFPILYIRLVEIFGPDIGESINEYEILYTDFPMKIHNPNISKMNDMGKKYEALPSDLKRYSALHKIESKTGWDADDFFDVAYRRPDYVLIFLNK